MGARRVGRPDRIGKVAQHAAGEWRDEIRWHDAIGVNFAGERVSDRNAEASLPLLERRQSGELKVALDAAKPFVIGEEEGLVPS